MTACLLLAISLASAARGAPAVLTDKDVLALIKAGLPASTIVAKIKASRTDFDTSAGQLVKLSKVGAGASVLEAMIQANSAASSKAKDWEYVDWQAVQCNDEASARRHLDAYPRGQYEQPAQECLIALQQERLDWREVQCGNVASVRGFLEIHPGGHYEQRAKDCLAAIAAQRKEFRDCPQCPKLVVLPAGTFMMGSPVFETDRYDDEGPQHRVTIAKPLAVGKYEVTRLEFGHFVSATGYSTGNSCHTYEGRFENRPGRHWRNPGFDQGDSDPVTCVSWEDAWAYIEWLSSVSGKQYRLLSESEWEYAARAGTTTRFHFGDTIPADQANYDGSVYRERTVAVGSFPANDFGLHDMHGNVQEWVEDCWHDGDYWGAPSDGSAWTWGESDYSCGRRVQRGGDSALRSADDISDRDSRVGFRVARALTP